MVLRYSSRFSRRIVTRPGSGLAGSTLKTAPSIQRSSLSRSAAEGCGFPAGGIICEAMFFQTVYHSSVSDRCALSEAYLSSAKSPFFSPSPWQS